MRILNKNEKILLTFPDASVLSFELNKKDKKCSVITDSSHVGGDWNQLFETTELLIEDWSDLVVREWDGHKFRYIHGDLSGFELKDICENDFSDEIVLKGFTFNTDYWIEYKFIDARLAVSVDSQT